MKFLFVLQRKNLPWVWNTNLIKVVVTVQFPQLSHFKAIKLTTAMLLLNWNQNRSQLHLQQFWWVCNPSSILLTCWLRAALCYNHCSRMCCRLGLFVMTNAYIVFPQRFLKPEDRTLSPPPEYRNALWFTVAFVCCFITTGGYNFKESVRARELTPNKDQLTACFPWE